MNIKEAFKHIEKIVNLVEELVQEVVALKEGLPDLHDLFGDDEEDES